MKKHEILRAVQADAPRHNYLCLTEAGVVLGGADTLSEARRIADRLDCPRIRTWEDDEVDRTDLFSKTLALKAKFSA